MLRSRTMLRVEKQSLGTNEGQGQESERKGVSSPSSSPDLDLEPLPIVPLRRSDRLKENKLAGNRLLPVTCSTPSPKKKSSANIGSCNGLLWAEQQAEHAANDHSLHESADQTINQSSDGFTIVNLQWGSFASGATVIIAIAIIGVLVTVCCYFKAKTGRRRDRQVLESFSCRVSRASHSGQRQGGFSIPLTLQGEGGPPALANSHWVCTAYGGWTSLPPSWLPHSGAYPGVFLAGDVQEVPFPQYPPVAYQPPFAYCGIPGCRREAITYRTRPALVDSGRFTEVLRSSDPRGPGHLLASQGDECRSPTPSNKSRFRKKRLHFLQQQTDLQDRRPAR